MSDRTFDGGSFGFGYFGIGEEPVAVPSTPPTTTTTPVIVYGPAVDRGPAHLTFPLRLGRDGMLVSAQQDSLAEVESAVYGIIAQRKGYRTDRPEVGIDDPAFEQGGANLDAIRADVVEQEPRADPLLTRDPSLLARMLDDVSVTP